MRVIKKYKGFRLIDIDGVRFSVARVKNSEGGFKKEWTAKLVSTDDDNDKKFLEIEYALSCQWEAAGKKFKTIDEAIHACNMSV